jgi:hypothetical protein
MLLYILGHWDKEDVLLLTFPVRLHSIVFPNRLFKGAAGSDCGGLHFRLASLLLNAAKSVSNVLDLILIMLFIF